MTTKYQTCRRCFERTRELYETECIADPIINKGLVHCPECGITLTEAFEHPRVCKKCRDRVHPWLDAGDGRLYPNE